MSVIDIIKYIVWYAKENDISLSTNRLVKFIYLVDLYHARLKNGRTLTGFPWRFISYGPFCGEALQSIEQAVQESVICKKTYDSHFGEDKEFNIFTWNNEYDSREAEKIEESIHIGILGRIQKDIRTLGDDTPQLLDYVYFETEPMANIRKGELLDFSKAKKTWPIKKIQLKELTPDVIKLARKKIKELSDEMSSNRKRLIEDEQATRKYKDDIYYQFIKMVDGETLGTGLKGTAKIQMAE